MTKAVSGLLVWFGAVCVAAYFIGALITNTHRSAKKSLRRIVHGKR